MSTQFVFPRYYFQIVTCQDGSDPINEFPKLGVNFTVALPKAHGKPWWYEKDYVEWKPIRKRFENTTPYVQYFRSKNWIVYEGLGCLLEDKNVLLNSPRYVSLFNTQTYWKTNFSHSIQIPIHIPMFCRTFTKAKISDNFQTIVSWINDNIHNEWTFDLILRGTQENVINFSFSFSFLEKEDACLFAIFISGL